MSAGRSVRIAAQSLFASASLAFSAIAATPASAATETFEYRIDHPRYGDIGTYVNVVHKSGAETEVDTELRIAVKVLGIVVYREEAKRVERWRGDKLVAFDGTTVINGDKIELHGEARDEGFVINAPAGRVTAPASVHPSNPWSPVVLKANVMMSTQTGRVTSVAVTGGDERTVTLAGRALRLRQYEVVGEKRQFVWFDDHGCPIAFRVEQGGANIDFVLVRRS